MLIRWKAIATAVVVAGLLVGCSGDDAEDEAAAEEKAALEEADRRVCERALAEGATLSGLDPVSTLEEWDRIARFAEEATPNLRDLTVEVRDGLYDASLTGDFIADDSSYPDLEAWCADRDYDRPN